MNRSPWMRTSHPCASRRGRAPGFTLVELMIIMTIMGILAGIAAPFIDVAEYRARAAVRELGSTLLAAQRLAVTRQHNVIVAFDVAGRTLRLHEDADNDGRVEDGEVVRYVALAEGIVFGRGGAAARPMGDGPVTFDGRQDDLPSVTFQRNGAASEEGGFYVTSTRDARTGSFPEDARAVEIERSTGRATWLRYADSGWRREF